ncbi:MAG: hypothetical protein ABIN36_00815 [Ferruginibacter sp.]
MKTTQFNRRNLLLCLFIIAIMPLRLYSQDLTGMWTGKIYTTEKVLPYEVAISEKDGKLSGFSYTTFNVKGEEMVAMKSIIVRREKGKVIIEDADLVFNSFDEESPKQLKQTNVMELEENGKTMIMYGKFQTLKTKQFRSMSGNVRLRKDSIIEQPKLIAKLDEMELSKSLSFIPQPELANNDVARQDVIIEEDPTLVGKTDAITTKPKQNATVAPASKVTTSNITRQKAKPIATISKASPATAGTPKPGAVAAKPPTNTSKPATAATPATVAKKPAARSSSNAFATTFGDRTLETIQTVVFKSDSLKLTLYDNGDVDGDTVSILLNGKVILSKQGLSTNAVNKTIYFTPDMGDSLQLVMYAENLGAFPPNTGLLIIKDGRDRYEIRFSGDLKKNAAIILKRRRDE